MRIDWDISIWISWDFEILSFEQNKMTIDWDLSIWSGPIINVENNKNKNKNKNKKKEDE